SLLFLLLGFRLLDAVDFRGIHDLDFEIVELGINLVEVLRSDDAVGERVVDIVVGEVALFLGEDDQFANLFCQVNTRLGFDRACVELGVHLGGIGGCVCRSRAAISVAIAIRVPIVMMVAAVGLGLVIRRKR